jgi:hypothetical protein
VSAAELWAYQYDEARLGWRVFAGDGREVAFLSDPERARESDARLVTAGPSAVRALAPFARAAREFERAAERARAEVGDGAEVRTLTLGDCRAAARVLAEVEALAARAGEAGK